MLSTAPSDEWLFAFFPKREGWHDPSSNGEQAGGGTPGTQAGAAWDSADGLWCLWQRGMELDNWTLKECWPTPLGKRIVAASWTGAPRQLRMDASGSIERLPLRGLQVPPVSGPVLLLVNQAHQLSLHYYRNYVLSMVSVTCSLNQMGQYSENKPYPRNEQQRGPTVRLCTDAAIGQGYNDNALLLATHASTYPRTRMNGGDDPPATLDVSDEQTHRPPGVPVAEYESWGEESMIYLARVVVQFDGIMMHLGVEALNPVYCRAPHVGRMQFIATPPTGDKHELHHLAVTYLDYGNYSSPPESELVLYTVQHYEGEIRRWAPLREASRTFPSCVIDRVFEAPSRTGVYVVVLDTTCPVPSSRSAVKEAPIGKVVELKISDLSDAENTEPSLLVAPASAIGSHLPLSVALSPNSILLCTVGPSLGTPSTWIQSLPRRKPFTLPRTGDTSIPPLSSTYALALLTRSTTDDLAHVLAHPSLPKSELSSTMYHAMLLSESRQNGLPGLMKFEALGVVTEAYKMRAKLCVDEREKERLERGWMAIHDLCSLSACNRAFDDCREGGEEEYDRGAVWQLLGLSCWVVEFVEKLVKQCIRSSSLVETMARRGALPTFTPDPPLDAPALLLLAQPFALFNLQTVLEHVRKFRAFLAAIPPQTRDENIEIASTTLTDLVACSGINFPAVGAMLMESIKEMKDMKGSGHIDEGRKSLATAAPTPAMKPAIQKIIKQLLDTEKVNKSLLFLKASDLVDDISHLSLHGSSSRQKKIRMMKDVILKTGLLPQDPVFVCLRCGGHSQAQNRIMKNTGPSDKLDKWGAWEGIWTRRCICGGSWASSTDL